MKKWGECGSGLELFVYICAHIVFAMCLIMSIN